jgi:hypothetical protein
MSILYTILTAFGVLWAMWYLYVIVMGLYRAQLAGRLSTASTVLGFPALVVGWSLDWMINWTIASLWFWELPASPDELVTGRLTRYIAGPPCLRKHHAQIICQHLLDVFDPSGSHCA